MIIYSQELLQYVALDWGDERMEDQIDQWIDQSANIIILGSLLLVRQKNLFQSW